MAQTYSSPDAEAEAAKAANIAAGYTPNASGVYSQPTSPATTTPISGSATTGTVPVTSGPTYTASSPEVQAEIAQYPGLSTEAAIGNVVTSQANSGIITSEPAQTMIDQGMQQNEIDRNRLSLEAPEIKTTEITNPEADKIDKEYADYIGQIEAYRVRADEQYKAMIDDIHYKYTGLREEQKIANQNRLKVQEILGTRSGRQRYAPEIQEGILSAEEKAGFKRLSDLQREESSLVNQAQAAHEASDFQSLSKIFDLKIQNRKEQTDALNALYERAYKDQTMSIQKAQEQRAINKDTLDSVKNMAMSGMSLTDEQASTIDATLGAGYQPGFTKNFLEFAKREQTAKTDADILDTQSKLFDTLSNMTPEQSLSYKGITYHGAKVVDPFKGINSHVIKNETTGEQKVVYERLNPTTGIPEIVGEQINNPGVTPSAGKLDGPTATFVRTIAGGFDNEQAVKDYNKVGEAKLFVNNLDVNTKNPADDQGLIYAFAKAMDPASAVKDGEYATVQKYQQSWAEKFGFDVKRIYSNSIFLTPEARQNMKNTIESKYKAGETQFDNIYNEYGRRIDKVTGFADGKDYLTDYSKPYNPELHKSDTGTQLPPPLPQSVANLNTVTEILAATKDATGISPYYDFVTQMKTIDPNVTEQEIIDELKNSVGVATVSNVSTGMGLGSPVYINQNTPGISFNKDLSKSQNSSTNPSVNYATEGVSQEFIKKLAVQDPPGSRGGQCVTFLHTFADFPSTGDTRQEKFATVDKYGVKAKDWQPKTGDIIITNESDKWGHGAMVNKVDLKNGTITLTESNYHGNERVTNTRTMPINSPKIYGALIPNKYYA